MAFSPILTAWTFPKKLLFLLLVIFLPASGIIVASSLDQREHAIRHAEERSMLLVQSLAAQQEQITIGTRQMLSTLAQLPEVQKRDMDACNALFHEVKEKNPQYSTITAFTPDGTMFAASAPFEWGRMYFADRKYLRDVTTSHDFSAGEYVVGRLSNVPTLNYAYPVLDAQNRLIAIVAAGFKLDQYARFISAVDLPEGYALSIVDHKGVRLYRLPEVETNAPGIALPDDVIEHITGNMDHGIYERIGQDGAKRIYAFKQLYLREDQSPYLYMIAGISKETILREADFGMLFNLAILGTTALVVLFVAWFIGTITIVRPLGRLVEATRSFGKGEMGSRTGLPHSHDELGQLAASFDEMACRLEMRDMQRKKEEQERLQLEQRLYQSRKAESLGRMAGAIAHHFNNMLGVIMGNLELVLLDVPRGSEMNAGITEAMDASRRAAEISGFMLAYLGQTAGRKCPLDFTKTMQDIRIITDAAIPGNITLRTEFSCQKAIILADVVQMKQILTGLLLNAVEAIGDKEGTITVATCLMEAKEIREPKLFPLEWEPKAENYACLSVTDDGCGFDTDSLEKAFDPFFSTKLTGRGLGLPISLGLARGHGGAISVESESDRGATFKVFFPLMAQQELSLPGDETSVEVKPINGASLILVVDDEPMLREMAASMLKQMTASQVITACDGFQALDIFSAHRDEISLVLLDIGMPGMNGRQTLEALRGHRPDIPVILASGYDESQVMRDFHSEMPQAFLHKPFKMAELAAALGKCGNLQTRKLQ